MVFLRRNRVTFALGILFSFWVILYGLLNRYYSSDLSPLRRHTPLKSLHSIGKVQDNPSSHHVNPVKKPSEKFEIVYKPINKEYIGSREIINDNTKTFSSDKHTGKFRSDLYMRSRDKMDNTDETVLDSQLVIKGVSNLYAFNDAYRLGVDSRDNHIRESLVPILSDMIRNFSAVHALSRYNKTVLDRLYYWLNDMEVGERKASSPKDKEIARYDNKLCDNCFVRNYKYIHYPKGCGGFEGWNASDAPDAVVVVMTSPNNFLRRKIIRRTWGNFSRHHHKHDIRMVFLIGKSTESLYIQDTIDAESVRYQDIVQQDFLDTYNNLTLKVLMGFEWASKECKRSRYVFKVDDDVYVNVTGLLDLVHHSKLNEAMDDPLEQLNNQLKVYYGRCHQEKIPFRKKSRQKHYFQNITKWLVNKAEYPQVVYPPYCEGAAYILPMPVVKSILKIHPNIGFFRFEDVYIGMCAYALNVTVHDLPNKKYYYVKQNSLPVECDIMSNLTVLHKTSISTLVSTWNSCYNANIDINMV